MYGNSFSTFDMIYYVTGNLYQNIDYILF